MQYESHLRDFVGDAKMVMMLIVFSLQEYLLITGAFHSSQ